ncbi:MAG: hypothetical protein HPY54_01665 [Chthonomonadetes bacterium]|nr:hypothetical protein [Chthonomonadetes bacterium]
MQAAVWLAAITLGMATYIVRKMIQVSLTGALYTVWAGPYPPYLKAPTPLQEVQMHLLNWWHHLSWQEWLTITAFGAITAVLLRVRYRNPASRLLCSPWFIPALALLIVYIDYPLHQWIQRTGIVWLGFLLLMALVFAINLIWIGLLEQLLPILEGRMTEWFS